LQLNHPAYVKYRAKEIELEISIAMAHHSGLSVYFYCTSNHVVEVYSSLALRAPISYGINAIVMVAEFKFLASVVIFCGVAAEVAICTRTSVYRAFSVYLWQLVTPNTSAQAVKPRSGRRMTLWTKSRVLAGNELEKSKKGLLALASERRAA